MRPQRLFRRLCSKTGIVVLLALGAAALVVPTLAGALQQPVIDSPADGSVLGPGPRTITFTDPDVDATRFDLFRAGTDAGSCDSTPPGGAISVANVPDDTGPLVDSTSMADDDWCYWVESSDGGVDPPVDSAPIEITYDTTPPVVAIDPASEPADPTNATGASFVFSASDGTVLCQIDSSGFAPCTSGTTEVLTGLGEGSHTFTVQSTDLAGNVGSDTYTWTVDTTAPVVTITPASEPANPTSATSATFAFTVSDGSVQCKLDSGSFGSCTSGTTMHYTGLSEASHTFTVQSTDGAGNVGSDSYTWTVDHTAPVVTISPGSKPPLHSSSTSASFVFSVSDGTVLCQLDSGGFGACTSGTTEVLTGLGEGSHTFTVQSTDGAGNVGSDTYTWTVDTTAPVVAITAGSKPAAFSSSTTASFAFTVSDGTVQCKLDSGAFGSCSSGTTDVLSGLAEGSHTFTVQSTDLAGNVGSDSYSWTVDTTAPTVHIAPITEPASLTSATTASFTFSVSDGTILCKVDSGAFGACTSGTTMNLSGLADGSHTFTVKSTDLAGNVGTDGYTWTVDATPPGVPTSLTLIGPTTRNTQPQFTFNTTTDLHGPVTYELYQDGADTGVSSSSGSITDTQLATDGTGDGTFTYTVRAVDAVGNQSAPSNGVVVTINAGPPSVPANVRAAVSPTNIAPVISWAASTGTPSGYRVFRDGTLLSTVNAPATTFSDFLLPLNGSADGDHAYTIVAIDSLGNASAASAPAHVLVDTTRPAPSASLAATSPTAAKPVLVWPASASGDTVGYNVYRSGMRLNSTLVVGTSFTDSALTADGSYTYTVRAVDSAGNESLDSTSATVVYDTTAPSSPVVTAVAGAKSTVALSWLAASDAGSGVAGYQVRRSAPNGTAPLNPASGTPVCGALAASALGCSDAGLTPGASYRYSVFAVDKVGNVSSPGQSATVSIPTSADKTPPKAPTSVRTATAAGKVTLSWKNPKSDLAKVEVVWNASRAPRSVSDGKAIYRGTGTHVVVSLAKLPAGKQVRFAIFALDRAGNVSSAARASVKVPAAGPLSIAPGGKLGGSPTLSWKSVSGATYYNVQVFEGSGTTKRVGIAWPVGTTWQLPSKDLKKGKSYTWYVWPGLGAKAAVKYGPLIGKQTFIYTG